MAGHGSSGGGGADNGIDPGRCHFRYYRRHSVISDVIGKASTVKGFASAREPFRIFHISPRRRVARYFLKRPIRISGRAASHGGHEKQNVKFIPITSNAHYQKRSQLYSHFLPGVIARRLLRTRGRVFRPRGKFYKNIKNCSCRWSATAPWKKKRATASRYKAPH